MENVCFEGWKILDMILQQHPNFHRCPHYKELTKKLTSKAIWFWIGVQIYNYNKKWKASAAAEPKISRPFEIDCSSDDNSTNTQNQASREAFIPPVLLEAPAAGSEVALLPLDEPAAGANASIPLPQKKNKENAGARGFTSRRTCQWSCCSTTKGEITKGKKTILIKWEEKGSIAKEKASTRRTNRRSGFPTNKMKTIAKEKFSFEGDQQKFEVKLNAKRRRQ
jgi:hypothetical protein